MGLILPPLSFCHVNTVSINVMWMHHTWYSGLAYWKVSLPRNYLVVYPMNTVTPATSFSYSEAQTSIHKMRLRGIYLYHVVICKVSSFSTENSYYKYHLLHHHYSARASALAEYINMLLQTRDLSCWLVPSSGQWLGQSKQWQARNVFWVFFQLIFLAHWFSLSVCALYT